MKLRQLMLLVFIFLSTSNVFADAAKEYEQDVRAVNNMLKEFLEKSSFCPGIPLALSCGDELCEADDGENETTCPADCLLVDIHSYNSQTFCPEVKEVFKPETYPQVQKIVARAAEENLHVKVIGTAHSTNTQLCTDGVIISTEKLNRIIGIERFEGNETVVVEPGVTERELTDWLHSRGRSIGYGLVGYRGITVGGLTATGAHGSSPKHSALLSSSIQSLLMVTADGQLAEFSLGTSNDQLFKALRTHLGMFGVVVQMRIKIRPQFNLDTQINFESDSSLLRSNPLELVKDCDFGQIHWFPSTKKIMKTCGMETTKATDDGAENIYLNPYIPPELVVPYKVAFHFGACSSTFNALYEKLRFTVAKWQPPLVKRNGNGKLVNTTRAIGSSHRVLSSELGLLHETLIVRDWEVAIPQSQIAAAMKGLKRYFSDKELSLPITGVYLRFTPVEETTLISNAVGDGLFKKGEIATFIEFPSYYPIGFPVDKKEPYSRLYEGAIKLLIEKYHGRPHWGKNNEAVFKAHRSTGNEKAIVAQFKKLVESLDPNGLFSNDYQELILGGTKTNT